MSSGSDDAVTELGFFFDSGQSLALFVQYCCLCDAYAFYINTYGFAAPVSLSIAIAQTASQTHRQPCSEHKSQGSQSTGKYVAAATGDHTDRPDTSSTSINRRLPDEALRLALRLATLDEESLKPTFSQPKEIATYRFMEGERSYEPFANKRAFARVCRQWREVVVQFLYEYVSDMPLITLVLETDGLDFKVVITSARQILLLGEMLEERVGGVKRGWWTKRLDIDPIMSSRAFNLTEETLRLLEMMPNLETFTIPSFENPVNDSVHQGWLVDVQLDLGKLLRLRRVEWHGPGYDLLDLYRLTQLCTNLEHVAVTLELSSEASPDAVPIAHDRIQTLMLNWHEEFNVVSPSFTGWSLPGLRHISYFLHYQQSIPMLLPLLRMHGAHIRSLEMPILERWSSHSYLDRVLPLVPNLDTIILDVLKTDFFGISNPGHANLCCVGWRLRTNPAMNDFVALHAATQYFNKALYPQLERIEIIHPDPLSTYTGEWIAQNFPQEWNNLVNGQIPVFDYHGNRAVVPVEDEVNDKDQG